MKRGPGRDLVREYVEACREFGLKVGFYYSLMDWHHPDGARCAKDEAARRRFLDFTQGCVRELMTQLRQDRHPLVRRVLAARTRPSCGRAAKMNAMVRELQPRHHHQQPLAAARGLRHARGAHHRRRRGPRLGSLHDLQRLLGLHAHRPRATGTRSREVLDMLRTRRRRRATCC